ncbi:MAG: CerR family C-terminal domain-containing protein [Candidatus Omnitrophica bacterium]|nr:CerR family C-terminal domain-containing protein [Candidatus Omnitrophota bacterium]MCM8768996.1 CerR family C-terminal domain-containing protein [Candidatus Omnitrophota bacterium]
MKPQERKRSSRTRERLLEVAARVFASEGYRGATIARISQLAGANIAAVNYHFGSKSQLYREAWRYTFSQSIKKHHPDGGVPETARPEERLKGKIKALISRLADRNNLEFQILQKELAEPTGLLKEVQRETLEPLKQSLEAVIRELLGVKAYPEEVQFCRLSIMSQCLGPLVRKSWESKGSKRCLAFREVEPKRLARYAEHVFTFSLGGLREIKNQREQRRNHGVDGKGSSKGERKARGSG